MLHPSYTDLINAVNSDVEPGEQPVVQSRYSIVLAASKRARTRSSVEMIRSLQQHRERNRFPSQFRSCTRVA